MAFYDEFNPCLFDFDRI